VGGGGGSLGGKLSLERRGTAGVNSAYWRTNTLWDALHVSQALHLRLLRPLGLLLLLR
jgi:hypothetical protein